MTNNWLINIGNGKNFNNSKDFGIWGINSNAKTPFVKKCKKGDILWFILSKVKDEDKYGKIFGCAEFVEFVERETGPLVSLTDDNEKLGWDEKGDRCDVEVHFTKLEFQPPSNPLYIGRYFSRNSVYSYENNRDMIEVNLYYQKRIIMDCK
jgi:hypothetical protein